MEANSTNSFIGKICPMYIGGDASGSGIQIHISVALL